jgi:hypothetical protein
MVNNADEVNRVIGDTKEKMHRLSSIEEIVIISSVWFWGSRESCAVQEEIEMAKTTAESREAEGQKTGLGWWFMRASEGNLDNLMLLVSSLLSGGIFVLQHPLPILAKHSTNQLNVLKRRSKLRLSVKSMIAACLRGRVQVSPLLLRIYMYIVSSIFMLYLCF